MSDGIIVSYGKRDVPELEALIQRHRVPVIWTNARREADCIYPDDEGGFFAATQELFVRWASTYRLYVWWKRRALQHRGFGEQVTSGRCATPGTCPT
jgi:hypothetical protein